MDKNILKCDVVVYSSAISSENIELEDLTLTSGKIKVKHDGALSLAGGSVDADGEREIGGESTLNLEGDLSVAGKVNIHPHAFVNFSGNTLNVSGGRLEIGGEHSFDSITTDATTALQVNTYLNMSRTDSGTSTIGDLAIILLPGDTGTALSASNMNLTISGSAP